MDQVAEILTVAALFACAFLVLRIFQLTARRRTTADHDRAQGSEQGLWRGRLCKQDVDWLWHRRRRRLLQGYDRDGYPVELTADHEGLTVALRGPYLRRLAPWPPVTLPWRDVAGAHACHRGAADLVGSVSAIRRTVVVVDVVGDSAAVWRIKHDFDYVPDDQEYERLRNLLDLPDLAELVGFPDLADDEDLPEDDEAIDEGDEELTDEERAELAQLRTEEEELDRELWGPERRPRTAPLRLVTTLPDGLVELVTARCSGHPWPAPSNE